MAQPANAGTTGGTTTVADTSNYTFNYNYIIYTDPAILGYNGTNYKSVDAYKASNSSPDIMTNKITVNSDGFIASYIDSWVNTYQ